MKKVFMTFSSSDWAGTRTRLKYQALESGWFDEVYSLDETSAGGIDEKYPERWNLPMHGYYFWKPIAIMHVYNKLKEGDVLIWSDAGNSINLNGWRQFDEKIKLLDKYAIVGYGMTTIKKFTEKKIYAACGLKDEDLTDELLNWPQVQANLLYIKKCAAATKILMRWRQICIDNPDALVEKFEEVKENELDGFIQTRSDQSVLAILQWQNKKDFAILNPNSDYALTCSQAYGSNLRALDGDIFPTRKKFNYKPFVSFVIGHTLPFFEKDYDEYTHFLNVGDSELHRMSDKNGKTLHNLKGMSELTGIYWIWRNIDLSDVEYISVSTYRKPFLVSNDVAWKLLTENNYDCIAMKYFQNRKLLMEKTFSKETIEKFYSIFEKHAKNELDAYKAAQENPYFYPTSSFIMSVDNFKSMCKFIFPIMEEFGKETEGEYGNVLHEHAEHVPPAGCFGENIISYYIFSRMKNVFSSPVVIYPKEKELFSYEYQPFGMVFGSGMFNNKELFYPLGVHDRVLPIIRNASQYIDDDKFFPAGYKKFVPPFIIQTNCIEITEDIEKMFEKK